MRFGSKQLFAAATATIGIAAAGVRAEVIATVDHVGHAATAAFKFDRVPAPVGDDLATNATVRVIGGDLDRAGGESVLVDGKLPRNDDDPAANFYFASGTTGGRVRIDLGEAKDIGQINTYSWHNGNRGPQVYKIYVADGDEFGLKTEPGAYVDPANAGWTLLTSVSTAPADAASPGGQYGVSLNDDDNAVLAHARYVLLDVSRTEDDVNANTFFSEFDVVAPDKVTALKSTAPADAGPYRITIDTRGLDDEMRKWAKTSLRDVCREWYPKLVEMLPSEGFQAPRNFVVQFKTNMGGTPAYAAGNKISVNLQWAKQNKDGEGVGAVVHEMVHVVQQYKFGRKEVPFWLQEGIPDYVRWYLYEPQRRGARVRDAARAKFDAGYRVSANFLNWVTQTYDKDIVKDLNAVVRQGKYTPGFVKDRTGKTLEQLNDEWKATVTAHD